MGFSEEDRKKVATGTLFNILGGVTLASSKAFQFVLRRLFGGPAFGLYAIAYGVMELCANFILGGYGDAITYHTSKHIHARDGESLQAKIQREDRLYAVLASALRTPVLIAFLLSFIIYWITPLLLNSIWANHDPSIGTLLRLVLVALPLLTLVHLLAESTRAHLDMRLPVIVVQTLFPLLTILIALGLFFFLNAGIFAMAWGLIGSLLICLPIVLIGFNRYYSLPRTLLAIFTGKGDKDVHQFAIPQCLNMASNLGLVKLDSLMLSAYISADAVGIYVLLGELAQLIRLPKMAFSGVFNPLVAKYQHLSNRAGIAESLSTLAQITSFLGVLVLLPVHLFYPEFILGANATWPYSLGLIWLLSVGPLMSVHFGLSGNLLLMTGHSRLLLWNSLGSLLLNILLNLLFIPHLGMAGAALAAAIANLTISCLQIFEMKKLEQLSYSAFLFHRIWFALLFVAPTLVFMQGSSLVARFGVLAASILVLFAFSIWVPGPWPHPLRRYILHK